MGLDLVHLTESRKKLIKFANANPAWFDMANGVLAEYHSGKEQLTGAIMKGLMKAYEMGAAGTPPVENAKKVPEAEIEIDDKPAPRRISRRK